MFFSNSLITKTKTTAKHTQFGSGGGCDNEEVCAGEGCIGKHAKTEFVYTNLPSVPAWYVCQLLLGHTLYVQFS